MKTSSELITLLQTAAIHFQAPGPCFETQATRRLLPERMRRAPYTLALLLCAFTSGAFGQGLVGFFNNQATLISG